MELCKVISVERNKLFERKVIYDLKNQNDQLWEKLIEISEKDAEKVLDVIRADEFGKDAVIIGEVIGDDPGKVLLETAIGGTRLVDMLAGEQLPRIC